MFEKIGLPELVIILVIVLLIFGAGKLPSIARDLGKSVREFRKAKDGEEQEGTKTEQKDAEKPANVTK